MRNAPEKIFVTEFPDLMPPTLITRDLAEIKAFRAEHGDIVMKPLYGHGGGAVFRVTRDDLNFGSLYDMFSNTFREQWVVQKFLPAIKQGDKRIILVDGDYAGAVNRIPAADDLRSNMVRGGAPAATELTKREAEICKRLGPAVRERGLLFVGIDVIDGYLTEINVTSPTGIRVIKNARRRRHRGADLGQDRGDAEKSSVSAKSVIMSVQLTIATTDYDHFRDFRLGLVKAEGIEANLADARPSRDFLALHLQPRMGRLGTLLRQVHGAGDAARRRHHRPAGLCLAAVSLLVVLREPQQGHQRRAKDLQAASASACRNGRTPPRSICAAG